MRVEVSQGRLSPGWCYFVWDGWFFGSIVASGGGFSTPQGAAVEGNKAKSDLYEARKITRGKR